MRSNARNLISSSVATAISLMGKSNTEPLQNDSEVVRGDDTLRMSVCRA